MKFGFFNLLPNFSSLEIKEILKIRQWSIGKDKTSLFITFQRAITEQRKRNISEKKKRKKKCVSIVDTFVNLGSECC